MSSNRSSWYNRGKDWEEEEREFMAQIEAEMIRLAKEAEYAEQLEEGQCVEAAAPHTDNDDKNRTVSFWNRRVVQDSRGKHDDDDDECEFMRLLNLELAAVEARLIAEEEQLDHQEGGECNHQHNKECGTQTAPLNESMLTDKTTMTESNPSEEDSETKQDDETTELLQDYSNEAPKISQPSCPEKAGDSPKSCPSCACLDDSQGLPLYAPCKANPTTLDLSNHEGNKSINSPRQLQRHWRMPQWLVFLAFACFLYHCVLPVLHIQLSW